MGISPCRPGKMLSSGHLFFRLSSCRPGSSALLWDVFTDSPGQNSVLSDWVKVLTVKPSSPRHLGSESPGPWLHVLKGEGLENSI